MTTRRAVILAAAGIGLLLWVADAVLDRIVFQGAGITLSWPLFRPPHEFLIGLAEFGGLLLFGVIMGNAMEQRERSAAQLAEAEAKLRQDAFWYRTIFNKANDAFYVHEIDSDGNAGPIVDVNDVATRMLGYTRDEFLTMFPKDVDSPDEQASIPSRITKTIDGGGYTFETTHRTKAGADIPVEVSAHTFQADGQSMVLAVVRDIRRRRAAEARIAHLNRVLRAVRNVNQLITQERDRDHLLQMACEALIESGGYTGAWIALLNEDGVLKVLTMAGPGVGTSPVDATDQTLIPCAQLAMEADELVIVHKSGSPCAGCSLNQLECGSQSISSRLTYAERTFGALSVMVPEEIAIDDEELGLVREVAGDLAFALHDLDLETQRARAVAALAASEQRYRELFENAPVGIFQTTVTGVARIVNPVMAEIVGCATPEEAIAHFTDLGSQLYVDPQRRTQFIEQLRRDGQVRRFEYRARRVDGTEIWLTMDANLVASGGGPPMIEGYTQEITARKKAENRIREQTEQLRQIMATVPEGIALLDARYRVLVANPIAVTNLAALSGAGVGDVVTHLGDRPLAELLTSPPNGLWHEVHAAARTFEVVAKPVEHGQEAEAWVLVIEDVTREREAQEHLARQARLAAIGQLASGIAHDFNNLIAVVVLYSQLGLRMPKVPDRLREYLETIAGEAHKATDLIQQILEIGRRGVLERMPVDLVPLLKEQVKLLERILPEHIRLSLWFDSDPYVAEIDPTRLQQAVMNLALNARDAMPEGGELRLTLARVRFEDRRSLPLPDLRLGEWITLAVADTGTGIAPGVLPHIFEPFFTTKGSQGTGLGLAQVHGIVDQHDGRVAIQSRLGEGTVVTLYLPPAPVVDSRERIADLADAPRGHGETILIVEDSPAVRSAVASALNSLGYHVIEASDGEDALALIVQALDVGQPSTRLPDLILSDLIMPRMGGNALLNALQEMELEIPFVVLSGHPNEDSMGGRASERLAGMLTKPVDLAALANLLAEVLG